MIGASFDSTKTPLRIEAAPGKSITREPELFAAGVVAEAYDEGPEKWDAEKPLEAEAS